VRRRIQLAGAVALLAVLGVVGAAIATGGDSKIRERLTGYQEVPALSTTGNGEFKAVILGDDEIRYRLTYRDTESPVTQAHIHFEQRTNNGGIVLFLCSNLPSPPAGTPACPPDGGTVRGTLGPEDVFGGAAAQGIMLGEFDEVLDAIRAGATYANVHTTLRPGGEIRAQLDVDDRRGHGGRH
jgi:hypothetical protein